jgi:hypothetical protein
MFTKEQWKEWYDFRTQFALDINNEAEEYRQTYLEIFAAIFDVTTYDSNKDRYFGLKILEVLHAIATGNGYNYQDQSDEHYTTFLMVANFKNVAPLLEWGTSIRGAWMESPKEGWGLDEMMGNYCPPQGLQPVLHSREEIYDFIIKSVELIKEQEATFAAAAASEQEPDAPVVDGPTFEEHNRRLAEAVNGISEALGVYFQDITEPQTDAQMEHEIHRLVEAQLPDYFAEFGDANATYTLVNESKSELRAWTLTLKAYNQHGTIAIQ